MDGWRAAAKGLLGITKRPQKVNTAQLRRLRGIWKGFPFDATRTNAKAHKARLDAALLEKWGTADVDAILDRIDRQDDSTPVGIKRKRDS